MFNVSQLLRRRAPRGGLPKGDKGLAHLSEYFGLWAMHEPTWKSSVEFARSHAREHIEALGRGRTTDTVARDEHLGYGGSDYLVTSDGVAVITVRGPMMKFASSFGGSGTVSIRRKVRAAGDDSFVRSLVMVWDTPGGTVSGTPDLADDIAAVAKKKAVYMYAEDLCASAGYWCFSQGTKCFANANALIGSLGVYMAVEDYSKAYEAAGIKTVLIRAGEYKGAGYEGTEITKEQIAAWQVEVDDINALFLAAVARGRRMAKAKVAEWNDGRAYLAARALEIGMIDGIQTLDETIAAAAKARQPRSASARAAAMPAAEEPPAVAAGEKPCDEAETGEPRTDEEDDVPANGAAAPDDDPEEDEGDDDQDDTDLEDEASDQASPSGQSASDGSGGAAPLASPVENSGMSTTKDPAETQAAEAHRTPATLEQLEAACYKADNDFLMAQLRAKATVDEARSAWAIEQHSRLERAAQERDEAQAAASRASGKRPGNKPLGAGEESAAQAAEGGDPIVEFQNRVTALVAASGGKLSRAAAVRQVAIEDPQLHEAFVAAYNQRHHKIRRSAGRGDYERRRNGQPV